MKTLQEAKEQVAKEHGYTSWEHIRFSFSMTHGQWEVYSNKAAELYAHEACREQREICAGVAEYHTSATTADGIKKAIKNAPEPTLS